MDIRLECVILCISLWGFACSVEHPTITGLSRISENQNLGIGFPFKSCASSGRSGPTKHQCEIAYNDRKQKVDVLDGKLGDPWKGVQIWTVPDTTTYSITALGASGGTGVLNTEPSKGAYAHAKFNLTAGEKIYMLVGQEGEGACSQANKKNQTNYICLHGAQGRGTFSGGGGGGGGGTFVFKMVNNTPVPMIIAGGGGGRSYAYGSNPVISDGGLSEEGTGLSSASHEDGPGAGGGWDSLSKALQQSGESLLAGGLGGLPCPAASHFGWEISGGFGGGGGGCTAGGGGGGYTGGNVSLSDNSEHNGMGGSSYIGRDGQEPRYVPGTQLGDGEVEIAYVLDCPCQFMCIYEDYENRKFTCYCAPNHVLDEDGLHCRTYKDLQQDNTTKPPSNGTLVAIVLSGIGFLLFFSLAVFCIAKRCRRNKGSKSCSHHPQPDYQLDRLRSAVAARQTTMAVTEYNPNYDFGGDKCTVQDLREIPREHLKLIRALGQGAFGEVYQGELSGEARHERPIPVAVKTLPALCTDQAEMDFFMEALIMSKFYHPNIVRFIGVCFEKHPRFIVLELLEGGDLKTFLRESRPRVDVPSTINMSDLIQLAIDIAKGCHYLEDNHFIHRDIAARNCLLTTKGPRRVAKIADFGMARDIYRADYYRKGGKAMLPVKWMPPEAFLDGIFTSKTDIWSFGILLWEVFSMGYMPYPGRGNQEVMQLVTAGGRLEPPKECPSCVYHVMCLCWHGIPERRPTFTSVIGRLKKCAESPELVGHPLPECRGPNVTEPDPTLMRPVEADQLVLSVEPPVKCLEPDSPLSTDPLIGPQSPDYKLPSDNRPANLSASAESLDRLLVEDETSAGLHAESSGHQAQNFPFFTFHQPGEAEAAPADSTMSSAAPHSSPKTSSEPSDSASPTAGPSCSSVPETAVSQSGVPRILYENWPMSGAEADDSPGNHEGSAQPYML